MKTPLPGKAIMLFDGDCAFCRRWIEKWRQLTGDQVYYEPYQQALQNFPMLTEAACKHSVQLIFSDGRYVSGAHAVLSAMHLGGRHRWLLACYEKLPLFASIAEAFYQWVARNRTFFSRWGRAEK